MKILSLILPIRIVSEANSREHWRRRNKRKQAQQREVDIEWKQAMRGRSVPLPCVVTLTRIAPRLYDDDNLRGAFKGIRDQIARLVGVDDADERIKFEYRQERRAPKQYDIFIEVEASLE